MAISPYALSLSHKDRSLADKMEIWIDEVLSKKSTLKETRVNLPGFDHELPNAVVGEIRRRYRAQGWGMITYRFRHESDHYFEFMY